MSQYLGRNKNKGFYRQQVKQLEYIKKLIANQDKELLKELENAKSKEITN